MAIIWGHAMILRSVSLGPIQLYTALECCMVAYIYCFSNRRYMPLCSILKPYTRYVERTDPYRRRMNEHVPENKIKALHFALLASLGVRRAYSTSTKVHSGSHRSPEYSM